MKTKGIRSPTSHRNIRSLSKILSKEARITRSKGLLLLLTVSLAACNNEIKQATTGTIPVGATSFELIDPTQAAGDRFGQFVAILTNGNIVVSDVFDSSVAAGNGAVHLYNPVTQALIGSVYGEQAGDNLGSGGIIPLGNGNYVVVSPLDDDGASVDVSSVRLVSGTTGLQIGASIVGDVNGDQLGLGGITVLANNNFTIASPFDTVGGLTLAGSVQLINGVTGAQIGATLSGAAAFDARGVGGTVALANSNFVIVSPAVSLGFVTQEGSVTLVNGGTGVPIATFAGDAAGDQLGVGGVVALVDDNKFVIASPLDDVGVVVNAGSIRLIDEFGAEVGLIAGDVAEDQLGFSLIGGVKALENGNYVVSSSLDDETFVDGGSVRLVSGNSGLQIGSTIEGESASEQLELVTVHANDTIVVASPFYDDAGGPTANVGSLRLFSGVNAIQIGATTSGDVAEDQLGLGSVIELTNNNYAIASIQDDVGGVVDAGSIMLWDGVNGSPIGAPIAGDIASDQLGFGNIIALTNNNFAVASVMDDDGATVDAGSVRLVNGNTGAQIAAIVGDVANDMFGSGNIVALANGNFVILSDFDDEIGNVDVGSVRLINGATGAEIGSTFIGTAAGDVSEAVVAPAATGGDYVLGQSRADKNGMVDSGQAYLNTD